MAKEKVVQPQQAEQPVGKESVTTLTQIIAQSLQSGDAQLLETALGITDPAVIEASLVNLPPAQVAPFITELTKRVDAKPGRLQHLLPWLQGCLSVHTATLMSNPSSKAALKPLEGLIERRLASRDELLKVAGRLDLLMMQVLRRTDAGEAQRMAAIINKPVAMYQADDDSEDDGDRAMLTGSESESEDGASDDEQASEGEDEDEMSE